MEIVLSLFASVVSVVAVWISWWTWRQSNRPIVVAKVKTHQAGNKSIAYDLVVMNVGARPAVDVSLRCDENGLRQALKDQGDNAITQAIRACFQPEAAFPLIEAGATVKNSFGTTGPEGTWNHGSRFEVTVTYRDVERRRAYRSRLSLVIMDSDSFGGGAWTR